MAEIPEIVVSHADDESAAAEELADALGDLGIDSPYVLASRHGEELAGHIEGHRAPPRPANADQEWASEIGSQAHRGKADALVAVGGGRCLDVGKLAAARAGILVISVPTQLSHDGICSPVAVVPDDAGRAESLGAVAPRAVFVSIPTLVRAPASSLAAGVGDLLANPLALRDWQLAADRGLDSIDERAWSLSARSHELIEPFLAEPLESWATHPDAVGRIADALIQSGMAMLHDGSSRPASGGEHEISHAIDELFGGRAMHGAQVAFGCIITATLYGDDPAGLLEALARLGLPRHPRDLGLDRDQTIQVLLHAPDTRPGRFTILEDADLDEGSASELIDRIWETI